MSTFPMVGALLRGRYRLTSVLGRGGMSVVYEGDDLRLGRKVAVKLLREGGDDEALVERLVREAKAAARAQHPAVIMTYGYGTDPELGLTYVIMELLQGETLSARIERLGPLSMRETVRVALECSDALVAVHAQGVIHRDLKPSNIFLATRGRRVDEVKLLDFGVAKQLDLETLTATGQAQGTPTYMAPEQFADSKRVDARCDIYSMGVVLFECLAGEPPFSRTSSVELAKDIMFGEQPDVRMQRPDVRDALADIVHRCMRKRARERFPDAHALYIALSALEA